MVENDSGFLKTLVSTVAAVFDGAMAAVNGAIEKSYRKGYEDGASAMRDSILKAAGAPLKMPTAPSFESLALLPSSPLKSHEKAPRASRGSVGQFINKTLMERGSMTQQELKGLAVTTGGLSAASVGNELHRKDGVKYRRDGQHRWHLIEVGAKESAADIRKESAAQEVYQPAA